MIIRDARPEELHTIRALTLEAYDEYSSIMSPHAWQGLRQALLDALEHTGHAARIVAEHNGHIVGSVLLYPPDASAYTTEAPSPWPELRLLAVPPSSRGLGAGRALVEECIRRSRAISAEYLGLHTSHSMRAAVSLYQAMGFERASQLDFIVDGSELVEGYLLPLTRS